MTKDKAGIYHAKFDCWQHFFGYNDFYDFMFDIGTSMKSKKFLSGTVQNHMFFGLGKAIILV